MRTAHRLDGRRRDPRHAAGRAARAASTRRCVPSGVRDGRGGRRRRSSVASVPLAVAATAAAVLGGSERSVVELAPQVARGRALALEVARDRARPSAARPRRRSSSTSLSSSSSRSRATSARSAASSRSASSRVRVELRAAAARSPRPRRRSSAAPPRAPSRAARGPRWSSRARSRRAARRRSRASASAASRSATQARCERGDLLARGGRARRQRARARPRPPTRAPAARGSARRASACSRSSSAPCGAQLLELAGELVALVADAAQLLELVLELLVRGLRLPWASRRPASSLLGSPAAGSRQRGGARPRRAPAASSRLAACRDRASASGRGSAARSGRELRPQRARRPRALRLGPIGTQRLGLWPARPRARPSWPWRTGRSRHSRRAAGGARRGGGSSTTRLRPSSSSAPATSPRSPSHANDGAPRVVARRPACRTRAGGAPPASTVSAGRPIRRPRTPFQRPTTSSRSSAVHSKRSSSNETSPTGGISSARRPRAVGCSSDSLERATGAPVSVGGGRWSTAATRRRRSRPSTATAKETLARLSTAPIDHHHRARRSASQAPVPRSAAGGRRRVEQLVGDQHEGGADDPRHEAPVDVVDVRRQQPDGGDERGDRQRGEQHVGDLERVPGVQRRRTRSRNRPTRSTSAPRASTTGPMSNLRVNGSPR